MNRYTRRVRTCLFLMDSIARPGIRVYVYTSDTTHRTNLPSRRCRGYDDDGFITGGDACTYILAGGSGTEFSRSFYYCRDRNPKQQRRRRRVSHTLSLYKYTHARIRRTRLTRRDSWAVLFFLLHRTRDTNIFVNFSPTADRNEYAGRP